MRMICDSIITMKNKLWITMLFAVFSGFANQGEAGTAVSNAEPSKPNIILIMADDLGYGDLGCYGSKLNSTPHVDRMAEQGVRLMDFHAASWCAPSRCGLMTGFQANRGGLNLAKRITIAEMLRKGDYATALIGKWHLGMNTGFHPLDQGFDYWFGTKGSNDWDGPNPIIYDAFKNAPESAWKTPLYKDREMLGICPQSQFTKRYTQETVRLIKHHKDRPFFIYLAHNMPHVPVFASDAFKGKSRNGVYGDVLMELDWSIGEIIDALKETGIDKKTLVVFMSDNGPWTMFQEFGGVASPLKGEKGTGWEGGDRVPCIFYWPDKISPSVNADLIINTDLYATLASFAGVKVQEGEAIDSHDISNLLLSGANSSRKKHIYFHHQPMAWRNGDYKIHFKTSDCIRNPETGVMERKVVQDPPLLFDISSDMRESKNIASQHPDIVQKLTGEFNNAIEALNNGGIYD